MTPLLPLLLLFAAVATDGFVVTIENDAMTLSYCIRRYDNGTYGPDERLARDLDETGERWFNVYRHWQACQLRDRTRFGVTRRPGPSPQRMDAQGQSVFTASKVYIVSLDSEWIYLTYIDDGIRPRANRTPLAFDLGWAYDYDPEVMWDYDRWNRNHWFASLRPFDSIMEIEMTVVDDAAAANDTAPPLRYYFELVKKNDTAAGHMTAPLAYETNVSLCPNTTYAFRVRIKSRALLLSGMSRIGASKWFPLNSETSTFFSGDVLVNDDADACLTGDTRCCVPTPTCAPFVCASTTPFDE